MLLVTDFLADQSDDICIKGDILTDDSSDAAINIAERRIVARGTDFLIDDIAASLERFIFKTKTPVTVSNIKTAITDSLLADRLFQPSDFLINVIEKNTKTLFLNIVFRSPLLDSDAASFRIIVDIENQRIYRG